MTRIEQQTEYPFVGLKHRFYHGKSYHCLSLKVTLEWDDGDCCLTPLKRQPEFMLQDFWRDEADRSSLLYPSDLIPFKPTTDVLIVGTARPPHGDYASAWHGMLRIGRLEKRLRFYGARTWQYSAFRGWALSAPEPVSGVALLYENAYGGTVEAKKAHYEDGEYYPDNPFGIGFFGSMRADTRRQYRTAQIEAWNGVIREFGQDIPAGGFGPIPGFFPDRYRHVGTWDEKWEKEVAPNIPVDMNLRYWNTAPADQQPERYLRAGDVIELHGLRAGAPLCLTLPNIDASILCDYRMGSHAAAMNLDTVHIDLNQHRVSMRYHLIVPFHLDLWRIMVSGALIQPSVKQVLPLGTI